VHFADLVVHTGVEKNPLGRRRLTGVDVGTNTNIAIAFDGCLASHDTTFTKIKSGSA
jgi:hypothetical protein